MAMFFTGASASTFKYNGVLSGLPATCSVGDLAFVTDATAGQQIYECSSTNTWTQQLNGGGGPPSGAASGDLGSNYPSPTVKQAHWTQKALTFAGSPYTVLATDSSINCDATGGAVVVNLPASAGAGKEYFVVKIDSSVNPCTVTRAGSDTIEGSTTVPLISQFDSLLIRDASVGSWLKVSPKIPGSAGNMIYNTNGSNFGAVAGTSADNNLDLSSALSNVIAVNRTYSKGHLTNAGHAIDTQITYNDTGFPVKENTIAGGLYGRTMWQGTGGGGHIGVFFARSYDNGVSATAVDTFDNYYSDFQFFGSATATNPITQATHFHAVNGTSQGGSAANVYANFAGFRYETQTWTSPTVATIEQAFVGALPALANAQLTTFYGLRLGGCTKGSKYSAMCIGGGASYFTEAIDQTITFDQTVVAPLTTGGIVTSGVSSGYHVSNFVGTNITGMNFQSLLTGSNGNTGATMVGFDSIVDNGGSGNPTLIAALRAKCNNSGGSTATKAIAVSIQAAANGGTFTDISGLEIAAQTNGVNTNTAQAIKQTGASDINTFAGTSYLNGNRSYVASDFTTSGSGTALETIVNSAGPAGTSLGFVLPLNTAQNVPFNCNIIYHQNTAAAAVAFGIKASVAPTQINATGQLSTSATAATTGNLVALTTTTATAIVSATPSAITTNWNAYLSGFIENPSGAASTITFLVSTATAADTVTVKRGSFCTLGV